MKALLIIASILALIGLYLINNTLGYIASYQEQQATTYEYHMNIDLEGYTIYSQDGTTIGRIPYGTQKALDTIFINDNQ
jgi:hypothetical protein